MRCLRLHHGVSQHMSDYHMALFVWTLASMYIGHLISRKEWLSLAVMVIVAYFMWN